MHTEQVCPINDYLPTCNELLFDIGMQLREQRGRSLSLVCFHSDEADVMLPHDTDLRRANTFLRWLLRTHVCIAGIEIQFKWAKTHSLTVLEELPEHCRLKKLIVQFPPVDTTEKHVATLIPRLRYLEELQLFIPSYTDIALSRTTDALLAAVSTLLRTTTCLTFLHFHAIFEHGHPLKTLIDALAANSTLKSLELWTSWTTAEQPGCLGEFMRSNRSLTKLTLYDANLDRAGLSLDEALLDHFTSLSLELCEADQRWFSALAKYVRATTVLRELRLAVSSPVDAAPLSCWTLLFDSISANTSVADLSISCSDNLMCNERLATTIGLSRYITRVSYKMSRERGDPTSFILPLSEAIADNYNLLEVHLSSGQVGVEARRGLFTIRETTRRNSSLVECAAGFNQTTSPDWYTANALEKVLRHPALMRELAELEGIAACEVARMIRSRLRSVEDLHDFMRITGVVKRCVTCYPPADGCSVQLQDLNDDCWRLLRRYLSFDDVKRFAAGKPDDSTPSRTTLS
ncbi:hypothetical protein HPB52_011417 [Rhipicephalus sanguineus]|uniref:Uncharacterized protein n=1 Tax=Rhipicephalus sanguineus TaxID=34632 RepID=A0A9D4PKH7_RHISA|nr:hypothetical protein HPB52_011417 [Rhipicephalus sanguineus]